MTEVSNVGWYWVIHYHHEDHYGRRVAVVGLIDAWRNPPVVRFKWNRELVEVSRVFPTINDSMLRHIRYCQDRLERVVRDEFSLRHDINRIEKAMDSLDRPYWKLSYVPHRGMVLYDETPDERLVKSWGHLTGPLPG